MKVIFNFIKLFFRRDFIYCTIVVFLFMGAFARIVDKFEFLNPIDLALSDFEMTDIVFSKEMRETPTADTNIVLVNIGDLPRRGIAKQLEIIAAQKPKVVGIDCNFPVLRKPDDDSLLELAMSKVENLVLFSEVLHNDDANGTFDTIKYCHPKFARYGNSGFCNLITPGKELYITCRTFTPVETIKNKTERAFGVEIARFVDSNKVNSFLSRNNEVELINYRGNKEKFYSLDVSDFIHYDENGFLEDVELPISLKDKIILMGYMGPDFGKAANLTRIDKFHTPMNQNYAGKSYPDMFGVVIHANIISMILNETTMNKMSGFGEILLAIVLCYLNVIFFFYIHDYYPSWYDLVVKTVQVLEVFILLYVAVLVYGSYSYQMDVNIAAIAVGLCGDILEVYTGAMYNIVGRFISNIKRIILPFSARKVVGK